MRRMVSGLMLLACLTLVSFSALAAGTTVTTFTPFADMDFAAQGYMDLITAWENETGNLVEDYSGLEDDVFMQQMQEMVASGRADIVVVPLGSGLAADKLVGVDELLAAAPDCGAKKMAAMAESDGSVLLTPVRLNWESLYINTDVLEANGVAVPTSYDELVAACASLAQKGVTPIANAMCEWAEIALDCAAMLGAPADQYGQQTSLDGAKSVLTALTQVGAFGVDPWNLTDEQAQQAFAKALRPCALTEAIWRKRFPKRGRRRRLFCPFLAWTDRRAPRWSARRATAWRSPAPAGRTAPAVRPRFRWSKRC